MGDTSSLRVPVRDRIPEQKAYETPEGPLRCAEFGPLVDVFVDVIVDGARIGTLEAEVTLLYGAGRKAGSAGLSRPAARADPPAPERAAAPSTPR